MDHCSIIRQLIRGVGCLLRCYSYLGFPLEIPNHKEFSSCFFFLLMSIILNLGYPTAGKFSKNLYSSNIRSTVLVNALCSRCA